ncbi:MAG: hypothetical protein ACI8YQ_001888 [Polaribacter sp.]|jgi:hypothetical protein
MKKYLLLIPALFLALSTFAQQNIASTDAAVQEVVQKFTTKYQLNQEQETKMTKIQQRRLLNLAEVSNLEQKDHAKFLQKRKAINSGTEVSVKMILDKEQRALYDEGRMEVRLKKADKSAELKEQGMTSEEMTPYLLAIEDEQY